jgi:hypothetical protein
MSQQTSVILLTLLLDLFVPKESASFCQEETNILSVKIRMELIRLNCYLKPSGAKICPKSNFFLLNLILTTCSFYWLSLYRHQNRTHIILPFQHHQHCDCRTVVQHWKTLSSKCKRWSSCGNQANQHHSKINMSNCSWFTRFWMSV